MKNLQIVIVVLALLVCRIQTDAAFWQVILWSGNVSPKAANTNYSFSTAAPSYLDSGFRRFIFLSGMSAPFLDTINFTLTISPTYPGPIQIYLNLDAMSIFEISTHVMFQYAGSSIAWTIITDYLFSTLNDQNGSVNFQDFTIVAPAVNFPANQLIINPWIQSFSVKSFSGPINKLGISIEYLQGVGTTDHQFRVNRQGKASYERVTVCLFLYSASYYGTTGRVSPFEAYYQANQTNLLSSPTDMDIPPGFKDYIYTGFQNYCGIGLQKIFFTPSYATPKKRSVMFNMDTVPFNSVENHLQSGDTFEAYWRIYCNLFCPSNQIFNQQYGCLLCPIGLFPSPGNVLPCISCSLSIPNCTNCTITSSQVVCLECQPQFFAVRGVCLLCTNTTCGSCLNFSQCFSCPNAQYCIHCSDIIPYCNTCLNTTCLSCFTSYVLDFMGNCASCSTQIPYCVQCQSNWTGPAPYVLCSACLANTFLNSSFQCVHCSTLIPSCSICANQSFCLQCLNPSYFFLSNLSSCVHCSVLIANCSFCSNQTFCLQCLHPSHVFFSNLSSCLPCETVFSHCSQCIQSRCTVCQSGFIYNSQSEICECIEGYELNGTCNTISGCADLYVSNTGYKICLSCDTRYYLEKPEGNICICKNGQLINGVCSTVPGCITPIVKSDGSMGCLFCNVTKKFSPIPVNHECLCPQKYKMENGACVEICGDGFHLGQYQCDDGNLEGGDGCSPKCQVQVEYRCQNGTSFQPSACFYVGIPLTVELKSIKKAQHLNQGIFKFTIKPPLFSISKLNLSQFITFTCQNATYNIANISYDSSGQLKILVDYSTDLETRLCTLDTFFNHSSIRSQNYSISFEAISQTLQLRIITYQEEYMTIKMIFEILSYIALAVFGISLGYKMVGAETMTTFQLICLSNAFYQRPFFFFNLIKQFGLVTGSWSLFHNDDDNEFAPPFSQRLTLTPNYIENNTVVLSVLLFFGFLWVIIKLYHLYKTVWSVPDQSRSKLVIQQQQFSKVELILRQLYRIVLFPVTAGFLIVLMISAYIEALGLGADENSSKIQQTGNSLLIIISVFIVSTVVAVEFNTQLSELAASCKARGLKQAKPWYVRLFLVRSVVFVVLIELGISWQYNLLIYVLTSLQLAYCIFIIIVNRPYKRVIDNLGVIACEVTTLYAFSLPLLMRFRTIEELDQMLLTFILQCFIVIVLVFSLIRVAFQYFKLIKAFLKDDTGEKQGNTAEAKPKKMTAEQQNIAIEMKQNPYSLYVKQEHNGIERMLPKKSKRKIQQYKYEEEDYRKMFEIKEVEDEDEQLKAQKLRLREDLLRKKNKSRP